MTTYNENIGYDAVIPWNGAVTPPIPAVIIGAGGYSQRYAYPQRKKVNEMDEEAIALLMLLLTDDD